MKQKLDPEVLRWSVQDPDSLNRYTTKVKDFRFVAARGGFVLLFLGLTLLQLFSFPGQFQHMHQTQGLSLIFEVALTLIVGLWLLCGQFALFALWKIVGEMKADTFYSQKNLVWIERLLLSLKTASVIPIALFLMIAPQADDPGILVVLSIATLFVFSLTATTSLLKDQIEMKARI
jgi:hypothetical protein